MRSVCVLLHMNWLHDGLRYDNRSVLSQDPPHLQVLWIDNIVDCRLWSYYCEIRKALARLHTMCQPHATRTCIGEVLPGTQKPFSPDVAIIGPRYSINVQTPNDPIGFNREQHARLPLLVIQNKMYQPEGWREIVGNVSAKLQWVRAAGAAAAFTWLSSHRAFTERSGITHHWLPFAANPRIFGALNGSFGLEHQPYDVGFTGASGADKYPLRHALLAGIQSMSHVKGFFGTWEQTTLNRNDNRSWKAGNSVTYAAQIASARIWLSTVGPSDIVGTRYFEVLLSGTTLLMCNRASNKDLYAGLWEDGVHVVTFGSVQELKQKVSYFLQHEDERRQIVRAAHALANSVHTWDARARFITHIAEHAIRESAIRSTPWYQLPASVPRSRRGPTAAGNSTRYIGCFQMHDLKQESSAPASYVLTEPPRSRNGRKLRRYTVELCERACAASTHFVIQGGGFATGNGHMHGRCKCARPPPGAGSLYEARRWPSTNCATTCSLHDSRPCGGARAVALYRSAKR